MGIVTIQNIYREGTFSSFEQLKQYYALVPAHFFHYLQARDFVRKHISDFEVLNLNPTLESIVNMHPSASGTVSNFYKLLVEKMDNNTQKIKHDWEEEMGFNIHENIWECLRNVHTCSVNARHNLIQFKVVHRLHYSKLKLHKIYPTISPLCNKCKTLEGTLFHSLLSCSKIQPFWKCVFKFLSEVYSVNLEPEPCIGLLGAENAFCSKYQTQAISLCMLLAKNLILQMWKADTVPTFEMWARELGNMLHLEELRFILKDKLPTFIKIWKPIRLFLQAD